ncbi:to amino acid permease [Rickettsia koreansis]|uniref:to amino acid permease n=1 Tax=Rickettsia koreansis TaxID=2358204 RepID=UPI0039787F64
MGKYFSGHTAQIIGMVSLKLLSYALLAVFIYGGSSILQKLLALNTSITYIGAWCIIITSKRNIYMWYSHSGSFYFIWFPSNLPYLN